MNNFIDNAGIANGSGGLSGLSGGLGRVLHRRAATPRDWAKRLVLLAGGVLLLSLSARVQVPFYPVPLTLQTMAVLAIAITYGMGLGVSTVVSYLLLGAMGAPVFAEGGGYVYFLKPTAGYLYGFILAAVVCGYAARRGWRQRFMLLLLALLVADLLIFVSGVSFLSLYAGLGWEKSLAVGFTPFILGDLSKVGLVAVLVYSAQKILPR